MPQHAIGRIADLQLDSRQRHTHRAEALRLGGDIVINMSALAFVDARCTLMIADAARTIASQSRSVTLRRLAEVATGFKRIGLADIDGIRLVADGDR